MKFYPETTLEDAVLRILEIDALITFILFMLVITFILFILYLRTRKIYRTRKKKILQENAITFINNILFDPDIDKGYVNHFRNVHLKSDMARRVLIKEIVMYVKNLKGEAKDMLQAVFISLELDRIILEDLKDPRWYNRARALYVSADMEMQIEEQQLLPLLNHERSEVRLQAVLYYIKLDKKEPFAFLDRLRAPLTLWQQIYIEDALKHYNRDIPDFSAWLKHSQSSVILFSVKMIAKYNQFVNIPGLLPFLSDRRMALKKQAIRSLCQLGYYEARDILVDNFREEPNEVKKEILYFMMHLGGKEALDLLSPVVAASDEEIRTEYLNIGLKF